MLPETKYVMKPIPEGLDCGTKLSEDEIERIGKLRGIVKTKYPLLAIRTDDNFLARFLCGNNSITADPEKAADRIYALYKFRKDYPKYTAHEPLSHFAYLIKQESKTMLKHRDRQGRRIFLCKLADYTKAANMYDLSKIDDIWFESVLSEEETFRNGVSVVMDVKGIPFSLLRWLTPTHGRAMSQKNEVAPIEIHYHVVNTSGAMKAALPFIFQFMTAERKKCVHFHYSNMKSLHTFIAPESLPSEYGGTGEPINYEEQAKTLLFDNEGRLLEAMSYALLDPEPPNWDNVCR